MIYSFTLPHSCRPMVKVGYPKGTKGGAIRFQFESRPWYVAFPGGDCDRQAGTEKARENTFVLEKKLSVARGGDGGRGDEGKTRRDPSTSSGWPGG